MEKHLKILSLAVKNELPNHLDQDFEYSIEVVSELIEAGLLRAIDASSSEGVVYAQTKITLQGREYLQNLLEKLQQEQNKMPGTIIKLFISHSSHDILFVKELVTLLRASLNLEAAEIRCTSIDGYRLPGGANTNEQLKKEVHSSKAFIGVISETSIKSLYVAFELGARWGANRPLLPLLAPGTSNSVLRGPLSGINTLNASNRGQIHQFLENVANELSITLQPAASFSQHIEVILNLPLTKVTETTEDLGFSLKINNYELVETDGGAFVFKSIKGIEHFVCPNCYPNEIKILQDRRVITGDYDCPKCKISFPVKPNKSKRAVSHKGFI